MTMTSTGIPTPRTEPDMHAWELVTAAQGGDRDAFAQLYERYVDVVFRYVMARVLGDRALAEDLTSETFLRALRRIDSVNYRGQDIGAWLVTIARNLVLDHLKSSRSRLEVRVGTALGDHIDNRTPEHVVLGPLITAEIVTVVRQCLVRLRSSDQRECLELRFLDGLSVSETAEVMGRHHNAIKALQHRGVRAMAQMPELTALKG